MNSVIYLVHPGEFVITNHPIYKIGRTANLEQRKGGYKPNSRWLYQEPVCNAGQFEALAIRLFCDRFQQITDLGREYFQGDVDQMVEILRGLKDGSYWRGDCCGGGGASATSKQPIVKKRKVAELLSSSPPSTSEDETEEEKEDKDENTVKVEDGQQITIKTIKTLNDIEHQCANELTNAGFKLWTDQERNFFVQQCPAVGSNFSKYHLLKDIVSRRGLTFTDIKLTLSSFALGNYQLTTFLQKMGIIRKRISLTKFWFGLYKSTPECPRFFPDHFYNNYQQLQ